MSKWEDPLFLSALSFAGVDGWVWYEDSLRDSINPVNMDDDLSVLNALQFGGVDNWDGFDHALDIYEDLKNGTF